jgi:hypothetical protein
MELAKLAQQWADTQGYRGRRLGYNAAGIAYWGNQPAITGLICATPDGAEGVLQGWKD